MSCRGSLRYFKGGIVQLDPIPPAGSVAAFGISGPSTPDIESDPQRSGRFRPSLTVGGQF